jgi:membrane protein implicated in regulation of membrane protease activity
MNVRPNVFALSGGPLAQALSVLVFAVLLVGAVVMGAVLLAAIVGIAAIAWIVFSIRFWWLGRKLGRRSAAEGDPTRGDATQPAGRLIEAEYTVLEERDPRRSPREDESK